VALLFVTSTLLFALALGRIHEQILGDQAARPDDDETGGDGVDGDTREAFHSA
jgi:hypothetical protein